MVMRPRHVLAAAAILTAVTLGSWAALSTDSPKPAPQAAGPLAAAPATPTKPRVPHVTKPDVPEVPDLGPVWMARPPCRRSRQDLKRRRRLRRRPRPRPAAGLRRAGCRRAAQPMARPRRARHRALADLALDNTPDWIGPNGLVARRAVDANGDGRDEGFVTSTGGASNDAYNLFGLAGCQLQQVRIAGPLRCRSWSVLRLGMPKASTARAPTGKADACSPSGASSGPTSNPMAAPPTPTPRPATAGPAPRWSVRWTPTTAGSPPSRTVSPG